ncbi:MAG: hypothetical protein U0807_08875 [Candidatus Binatia bacterium]
MTHRRGTGIVELLVGAALALAIVGLLTATMAAAGRAFTAVAWRAEAEDTAQAALELFGFDIRRAGFDPRASGVVAVTEARSDRLGLAADLDGDGTVDASSDEVVAWVCNLPGARLSRIIGAQSMPIADGVAACSFEYGDDSAVPIAVPAAGLDAAARARVRTLAIDLALRPHRSGGIPISRHLRVALRSTP